MRIAVMQPYFLPYAGYFRLFCAADLVVFFDCVQFLRRGWIHRNRLPDSNNNLQWLTLPLKKQPQEVLIKDLIFADNAAIEWQNRLNSFSHVFPENFSDHSFYQTLNHLPENPLKFLEKTLQKTCTLLELPFETRFSSDLKLPIELRGQDRIIAIAKHFKATEYINLAGGKELYDAVKFRDHGIKLKFLIEYQGLYSSILHRIMTENWHKLHEEIVQQSSMENL